MGWTVFAYKSGMKFKSRKKTTSDDNKETFLINNIIINVIAHPEMIILSLFTKPEGIFFLQWRCHFHDSVKITLSKR